MYRAQNTLILRSNRYLLVLTLLKNYTLPDWLTGSLTVIKYVLQSQLNKTWLTVLPIQSRRSKIGSTVQPNQSQLLNIRSYILGCDMTRCLAVTDMDLL